MELEQLKYPIGKYSKPESITSSILNSWIDDIESFPDQLHNLVEDLTEEQLNWRYRPGGWTIKQVVHHCADSHINSIIRFKLALTEDSPIIRPYFEDLWAETADATSDNIYYSLKILDGLHKKWVVLLRSLSEEQMERVYFHPEHNKHFTIRETVGTYSWHSRHHLAHIQQAIDHNGEYGNVI
ncbi:YfiT family bacillithiol transferase [Marinigracilibium pacificum]|uniref:Putative metal-dependent hydrolase n=1 Tax=Marinigracilibium pacificum TaxID=2729599 RepID=A0A848IUC4_9BACT|nr:putative metal-dependent hydrolase [Marinigracilibium pacificum]NMM47937.1 putative metal-dependent hydrolase [Marinigracilibium pacificum]